MHSIHSYSFFKFSLNAYQNLSLLFKCLPKFFTLHLECLSKAFNPLFKCLPKRCVLWTHSPLHATVAPKLSVQKEKEEKETKEELPEGVEDFDLEMKDDPTAVADYANNIFKYYREREVRVYCLLLL